MINNFKSGFVSIVGKPNVGKSTLMNTLIGEKLSIVTYKAQTTRHKILGIINKKDFQIIFMDTPGIISPKYELQKKMVQESYNSIVGADVIIWMVDIFEKETNEKLIEKIKNENIPLIILINKIDLLEDKNENTENELINFWKEKVPDAEILIISAISKININEIIDKILKLFPYHPPYFPNDIISDKPEIFFVSEIIREKIFTIYKQEIPYSTDVAIKEFVENENIIKIKAIIYVERESQKYILIGKKGLELKKVGTRARLDMEKFLNNKVYLELKVKVLPNWRKKTNILSKLGY
ncbi:MAG: GTPase Era [Bacteroidetes bacterium]|nr:GTPase Era [Bacteroidota bacterium]